jgi:hypothetical protein
VVIVKIKHAGFVLGTFYSSKVQGLFQFPKADGYYKHSTEKLSPLSLKLSWLSAKSKVELIYLKGFHYQEQSSGCRQMS